MKSMTKKEMGFYFKGGYDYVSNKYFTFKHVIDDDNIIIIMTRNVKNIKGNAVLIVDNNKGVYLKPWQVNFLCSAYVEDAYAVKLNRNFFKPYQFNFTFDDMSFEKEDTFDELLAVAKEQDEANERWTVEM